ncbi:hypothetical protein NKJ50_33680, partial [Mesorhizobium sp. M0115]|uniref:hypothetical protein n=1 Tax=Mesorhizobium sp. M0115 TaxID=2956883 RepID=UPI003339F40F
MALVRVFSPFVDRVIVADRRHREPPEPSVVAGRLVSQHAASEGSAAHNRADLRLDDKMAPPRARLGEAHRRLSRHD